MTVDGSITNTDLQNQLNLKAPLDNPTFTCSVSGIAKAMVGLGDVVIQMFYQNQYQQQLKQDWI